MSKKKRGHEEGPTVSPLPENPQKNGSEEVAADRLLQLLH